MITYESRRLFVHHFDCRRKTACAFTAYGPAAAGRRELRRVLRRHGDSAGIREFGLLCVRDVFVILISDIGFCIGRNHMQPSRTGACETISRRDGRRHGGQIFSRFGVDIDFGCIRKFRAIFDRRVGVTIVRLHVGCRANARTTEIDTETACQTEEIGPILRLDVDTRISRIIQSLADGRLGFLRNYINRD